MKPLTAVLLYRTLLDNMTKGSFRQILSDSSKHETFYSKQLCTFSEKDDHNGDKVSDRDASGRRSRNLERSSLTCLGIQSHHECIVTRVIPSVFTGWALMGTCASIFNNIVSAKSYRLNLWARSLPRSPDGAEYNLISISFSQPSLVISAQVADESCQHAVFFPQQTHASTQMSELAETGVYEGHGGSDTHTGNVWIN